MLHDKISLKNGLWPQFFAMVVGSNFCMEIVVNPSQVAATVVKYPLQLELGVFFSTL